MKWSLAILSYRIFFEKNLVRYIGWLDSTSLSMYEMESLLCVVCNLSRLCVLKMSVARASHSKNLEQRCTPGLSIRAFLSVTDLKFCQICSDFYPIIIFFISIFLAMSLDDFKWFLQIRQPMVMFLVSKRDIFAGKENIM